MKARFMLFTVVLLLLAVMAPLASAQDMDLDIDPCLGLSEEDCAYINDAYAALDGVNSFSMDYTLDVTISGLPEGSGMSESSVTLNHAGSGAFAMDLEGAFPIMMDIRTESTVSGPDGGTVNNDFRIVDGILYMSNVLGPDTWASLNLLENADMGAQVIPGLNIDPNEMADPEAMGDMTGMLEGFAALAELPGFLTYVRDGNTFVFTMDMSALFSAQEFQAMLEQISESDPEMAQVAMLGAMAPMILDEGVITVTQMVDPELGAVTGIGFNADFTIDGAMLDPELTEPIVIGIDFNVTISDLNGEFEFVAPENAQPLDEMMGEGSM